MATRELESLNIERGVPQSARQAFEEKTSDQSSGLDADVVDPNIVGWDGLNDPENPMNWPTSQKCINIGLMSLLTIIS
ncbi:hypothetical protein ACHAO9_012642, partial [Fusarium lateritium]